MLDWQINVENIFCQIKLAKRDFLIWQSLIPVSLHLHPMPLPYDFNGCNDGDKSGERYCLFCVRVCVPAFVCNIWKGLSYFWSQEERSRDGVWSPNRGASLLLGRGEKERSVGAGGLRNSLLWMSCYPAVSL